MILIGLVLATVALAPELLGVWLGAEFARRSTFVLRCLALGVLLNGLAQVPSALLQGIGRPDLTALLHVVELPFYLAVATTLIRTHGIEGAAVAWTARTAVDLVFFFGAVAWVLPGGAAIARDLARALGLVLPLLAACALPAPLTFRGPFLLLLGVAAVLFVWRQLLTSEEKAPITEFFAAAWRRAAPLRSRVVTEPQAETELTSSSLG
jgi:O-antigen/teichoic acid export membrane protein